MIAYLKIKALDKLFLNEYSLFNLLVYIFFKYMDKSNMFYKIYIRVVNRQFRKQLLNLDLICKKRHLASIGKKCLKVS